MLDDELVLLPCCSQSTWTCLKSNVHVSRQRCSNSRQLCVRVRGRGCFGSWQETLTPRRNKGPRRTSLKIGNANRKGRVRWFCYTALWRLESCAPSGRRCATSYRCRLQFDSWPLTVAPEGCPQTSVVTRKNAVLIYIVAVASNHARLLPVRTQTLHQSSVMSPIDSAVTALLAQTVRDSIPDRLWSTVGQKTFFPGLRRPGRFADNWPSSHADVKNGWTYVCAAPT
jgi:hypothetical protein